MQNVNQMLNSDFKPRCPRYGQNEMGFVVMLDQAVARSDKGIPMVICKDFNCQAVVGVLPIDSVWEKAD